MGEACGPWWPWGLWHLDVSVDGSVRHQGNLELERWQVGETHKLAVKAPTFVGLGQEECVELPSLL